MTEGKITLQNLEDHWDVLQRAYVFGDEKQFQKVAKEFGAQLEGFKSNLTDTIQDLKDHNPNQDNYRIIEYLERFL